MDAQTLYLVLFSSLLIQTAALLLTWRQNPAEVGLRDWGISATLMTLGSLMIMVGLFSPHDNNQPLPLTLQLLQGIGSAIASSGWVLSWLGIRRFYHQPIISYAAVPSFWLVFSLLFWPAQHLPGWRVMLVGITIVVCAGLIIWELQRIGRDRNLITHMASLAMTIVLLSWLARTVSVASDLTRPSASTNIDMICIYSSIMMSMTFTLALILLTNQRVHQRLREQASVDALTGALNRRAFFDASKPILASLQREKTALAIAVIDIDLFKKVNDNHGHAAGDHVLKRFTESAIHALREGDLFARYGGEEFVILFQNSSKAQATQAIERLRQIWADQVITINGVRLRVTFSTGISHVTGPRTVTLDALLNSADRALYLAKQQGRDRTEMADPEHTSAPLAPMSPA